MKSNERVVTFGELLVRLSTPDKERFIQANKFEINYGGAEANVAVSLAQFNVPTSYVSKVPKHELGQVAVNELRQYGVDTSRMIYGGDKIGIYFLEKGSLMRPSKVIYDRTNTSFSLINPSLINFDKIFADATWLFVSGISPGISEGSAEVTKMMMEEARKRGIKMVFDINLRKKLWNWGKNPSEVIPDLIEHTDVLIGNEMHLMEVFGVEGQLEEESDEEHYIHIAQKITQKYPHIQKVVITSRRTYNAESTGFKAILWTPEKLYQTQRYKLDNYVDRVGSGDAFTAGMIYGFIEYADDLQRGLEFGALAACLKHTIEGDFNLITAEEVEMLIESGGTLQIQR